MKLFVWQGEGVLQDYTTGMIVVMAPTLEDAIKAIQAECNYCDNSYPHQPTEIVDLGPLLAEPRAWLCWGGG